MRKTLTTLTAIILATIITTTVASETSPPLHTAKMLVDGLIGLEMEPYGSDEVSGFDNALRAVMAQNRTTTAILRDIAAQYPEVVAIVAKNAPALKLHVANYLGLGTFDLGAYAHRWASIAESQFVTAAVLDYIHYDTQHKERSGGHAINAEDHLQNDAELALLESYQRLTSEPLFTGAWNDEDMGRLVEDYNHPLSTVAFLARRVIEAHEAEPGTEAMDVIDSWAQAFAAMR